MSTVIKLQTGCKHRKYNYIQGKQTFKSKLKWLTSLPLARYDLDLSSTAFRDALVLPLVKMPSSCDRCGSGFYDWPKHRIGNRK